MLEQRAGLHQYLWEGVSHGNTIHPRYKIINKSPCQAGLRSLNCRIICNIHVLPRAVRSTIKKSAGYQLKKKTVKVIGCRLLLQPVGTECTMKIVFVSIFSKTLLASSQLRSCCSMSAGFRIFVWETAPILLHERFLLSVFWLPS